MDQMVPVRGVIKAIASHIGRIRRNHALEHATMHILSASYPNSALVGRAGLRGFHIYGEVPTERVLNAAQEGLRRLNAGQKQMAVHPNCGTNLVLAGLLAGLGPFLVLRRRPKNLWERLLLLPLACAVATLGIAASRPLGPLVQSTISTAPNIGSLRISGAARVRRAGAVDHHILTEG
jgi:hypothetical protein